jgi:hypothetical protein
MATTFEGRAHLGVETQRQWSDQATARTMAAWYRVAPATFSDTIAFVHQGLWRECHLPTSQAEADVIKIPRARFERLTAALCDAA